MDGTCFSGLKFRQRKNEKRPRAAGTAEGGDRRRSKLPVSGPPYTNSDAPAQPKAQILELQKQIEAMRVRRREAEQQAEPAEQTDFLEIEVSAKPARTHDLLHVVPAVMENNLSRKGIWAVEPDRHRLEWRYETEDIVGSLTMEMTLGRLSTFEMELVAWLLGRWKDEGDGKIRFSLRECTREFGAKWSGQRAEFLREALDRIDGTRFRGTVWERATRRRKRDRFGIVDRIEYVDRSDSVDGPSTEAAQVTVTLSSFMLEQLRTNQFKRLDWETLRQRIKSPLGKRLYVFLQGQDGFPLEARSVYYEISIDNTLMETLGCRDRHARRLRVKLARAGREIMEADTRYQEVSIRPARTRGIHVLRMVRTAS